MGELFHETLVRHGAVPDGYMADFVNSAFCSSREVLLLSLFRSLFRDPIGRVVMVAVLTTVPPTAGPIGRCIL